MSAQQKSLFLEVFGDSPEIKVLDFLIENRTFDYSMTEVAEHAGIARITISKFWNDLVKQRIVVKTREIGRATMYRFNSENPICKKLIEIDLAISKNHATAEIDVEHGTRKHSHDHVIPA